MNEKECRCCRGLKDKSQFYKSIKNDDGLSNFCKDCADSQPPALVVGSYDALIVQRDTLLRKRDDVLKAMRVIIAVNEKGLPPVFDDRDIAWNSGYDNCLRKVKSVLDQAIIDCEAKP